MLPEEKTGIRIAYAGIFLPAFTVTAGIVFLVIYGSFRHVGPMAGFGIFVAFLISIPVGFCIALTGGIILARAKHQRPESRQSEAP